MTRLMLAAAFIAALFLTDCGGTPVLPGDLGKMTAGVLVRCEPIAGQDRSCLVLANPNNENLKVFDATARQFLLAPRAYTTLGIPVGARTSRLASAPGLDFVLALDVVDRQVYRVRTHGKTEQTPTFAVAAKFPSPADAIAFDFALAKVGGQSEYSLMYARPKSLRFSPIDNKTALQTTSPVGIFDVSFSHPISCIAADQDSGYLAVGFQNDGTFGADPKSISVIKLENIRNGITEADFTTIYIGGFASQLRLTTLRFGTEGIPFVFALKSDTYELAATRIDKRDLVPAGIDNHEFDHLLTALYLPPQDPTPCCGESKRWAAVMTVRGTFHYVTVDELVSPDGNPKSLKIGADIPLSDDTHLGSQAVFPTAIFGGPVEQPPGVASDDKGVNCRNRIFITFQSGLLASACEGQKGFTKVGL